MRLFLGNGSPGYTPSTKRGTWNDSSSTVVGSLKADVANCGSNTSTSKAEAVSTNNYNVLLGRFVSDAFAAGGTVPAGAIRILAGVRESSTSMNAFYRVHIYITTGDSDTPRATIVTDTVPTNTLEWYQNTSGGAGWDSITFGHSTFDCQAGDRVVVELGYQAQNTSTTSFTGFLYYGGTGTTELGHGDTNVTTRVGFIDFAQFDPLFDPMETGTDTSPTYVNLGSVQLTATAANNATCTVPSGIANGDFMLLAACNAAPDPNTQASFTEYFDVESGNDIGAMLGWRTASGEPANYNITGPTVNTGISACILGYRGVSGVRDWKVGPTVSTPNTAGQANSFVPPQLEGIQSTDIVLHIVMYVNDTSSANVNQAMTPGHNTGWTTRLNQNLRAPSGGSWGTGICVMEKVGGVDAPYVNSGIWTQFVVVRIALIGTAAASGPEPGRWFMTVG